MHLKNTQKTVPWQMWINFIFPTYHTLPCSGSIRSTPTTEIVFLRLLRWTMPMTVFWCVVTLCHRLAVGVISYLLQPLRDVDGKGTKRESYCLELHLLFLMSCSKLLIISYTTGYVVIKVFLTVKKFDLNAEEQQKLFGPASCRSSDTLV